MRMHNQNPDLYKLYVMHPQRNSLCFSDNYDETIVITQINEKINFLKTIGFLFNKICEIKCTKYTWIFKYEGIILKNDFKFLLDDETLVYLYINGILYKDKKMIDEIDKNMIYYNPLSFRQTDEEIKNRLYDILKENIQSPNLYFIGGEMVFFAFMLKPINFVMYTDFESIYDDALLNFPNNKENIHLIKYNFDKLKKIKKNYHLIANTSRNGLDKNLCKEILELELDNIVIISCNKKSFIRDFRYLCDKYKIIKFFDLNTNYTVGVYFLKLN